MHKAFSGDLVVNAREMLIIPWGALTTFRGSLNTFTSSEVHCHPLYLHHMTCFPHITPNANALKTDVNCILTGPAKLIQLSGGSN